MFNLKTKDHPPHYKNIHGIIVTYYPDHESLEQTIKSLSKQLDKLIIVNNGPASSIPNFINRLYPSDFLINIQLNCNYGLAHGQNIGIEHARAANATHIVIFDQDSLPDPNMISRLLYALNDQQAKGIKVAATAPSYRDSADAPLSGFVRTSLLGYKRIKPEKIENPIEVDFLISSGTLIPISALNEIGMMEESFFIDHIDTEWCFRAISKGYRLFGVPDATMTHSLGNKRSKIWFIRWRSVSYHSSFRYYYMFRNSTLLMRRNYIPLSWKLSEILRNLRSLFFYGLFSKNRFKNIEMMLKGILDGIRNRSGKASDN